MTIRLAISAGDPQGIGPEITAKAAAALLEIDPKTHLVVAGDQETLEVELSACGLKGDARIFLIDCPFDATSAGVAPSKEGGKSALEALEAAVALVESGEADALVTAPLSKEAVRKSHAGFVGHTGFLGRRAGVEPLMMLASDRLRVALVTDHVSLASVPETLTRQALESALDRLGRGLAVSFGIADPRIAVLGLNPHAGEGGQLGCEEKEIIEPVLDAARKRGARLEGPFAADGFFRPGGWEGYDAILAMYHDQGLIPLKALSAGAAVNISLGLPYCRTSPDHGTAFDLAGAGRADESSMLMALRWARARASGGLP